MCDEKESTIETNARSYMHNKPFSEETKRGKKKRFESNAQSHTDDGIVMAVFGFLTNAFSGKKITCSTFFSS